MEAVLIVLGVLVGLIVWIVMIYNGLVKLRNRFKNAFAQIDVQLRRRYDLIPNLVETSKAYLTHERETLESVIAARNHALSAMKKASRHPDDAHAMKDLAGAEAMLGQAMLNFNALTEAYPNLKADQTIQQLTEELTSTENRVAFARQAYNDDVMFYNTKREVFPNVLFANMFGFREAELFEIETPEVKKSVRVHL